MHLILENGNKLLRHDNDRKNTDKLTRVIDLRCRRGNQKTLMICMI